MNNFIKILNADKLILSISDISRILSVKYSSAKVIATRLVNNGLLIRLKRDFYISVTKFKTINENEFFTIANLLQTPSYISLTTALVHYNITTQQPQNIIESVAQKRTTNFTIENIEFRFTKIKKDFYFGFDLVDGFFIAQPEKAFADVIYLTSMKKYAFDFEAVDFSKINSEKVNRYLQVTNNKAINFWNNLCKIYKI